MPYHIEKMQYSKMKRFEINHKKNIIEILVYNLFIMKKIFISLLVSALCINTWFAGMEHKISDSYNSGYKEVVIDESLDFEIQRDGYEVEAEWNEYDQGDFKYYKLMKSYTNDNPVYPEDKAIFVGMSADDNENEFKDWSKESAYYRVCVITTENGRICSNVEKLEPYVYSKDEGEYKEEKKYDSCIQVIQPAYNPSTWECKEFSTPCSVKYGWKKVSSCQSKEVISLQEKLREKTDEKSKYMDRNLQKRADKAVEKIYNQLKEKNISDEQKVEYIEKIITKLEKVEDRTKSDRVKELVGYFIEKFEEKIDLIQQKDDIESIFDILEE